jgi:phosphoribosylanthranilate isomerase
MPVRAKICGVSTPAAIAAAIKGGASHVGFVFFVKSPRHVDVERAVELARLVPDDVGRVGLFVDPDPGFLAMTLARVPLDVVQLHGEESPAFAASVASAHNKEVWKAIPVRTRADLAAGSQYRGAVQRLVYDAKPPKGAELPGGNGLRFDWKLLDGHVHSLPWMLSGGLDAANVAEAVGTTMARMVDVSSGVETAPGVKNVDKIAAFLQAVAAL